MSKVIYEIKEYDELRGQCRVGFGAPLKWSGRIN